MTDSRPAPSPTWHDAFAQLPPETPPAGGWAALQARLPPDRGRRRWPAWTALAASLLLAVALPVRWLAPDPPEAAPGARAAQGADEAALLALQRESAQLETLLPLMSDERVASGVAALMTGELELRLADIDAGLRDPALPAASQRALWEERVHTLRALARIEGERSWLNAQGGRFDTALVRID